MARRCPRGAELRKHAMPKETFFNLPEAKRDAITAIAIEEFAEHAYSDVSISRIVARAGIAKGSFYQYFEDKEDLYAYLLDLIVERKRALFSLDHPDPQHVGVFNYLRWIAANGVRFEQAYPQLSRLAYRSFSSNNMPQAFQARARRETIAFYRRLVALGQAQGDINPAVDADLAAAIFDLVLASLNQIVAGYILDHHAHTAGDRLLFDQPEILRIYNQAIDILEHGLRAPETRDTSLPSPVPAQAAAPAQPAQAHTFIGMASDASNTEERP